MTQLQRSGAVVYAKDVARVAEFYARIVGLEIRRAGKNFMVLESSVFQLVVHEIPRHLADKITIDQPPVRREGNPTKLVFFVESIATIRNTAVGLGGMLNPVEREWQFEEDKVCDGHDPEGNVFQLREANAISL